MTRTDIVYLFILFIVCLPVVLPFLGSGYVDTTDGKYRLVKAAKYYLAIHERQIPPRWIGDVNQGLGEPTFVFTHPWLYILSTFIHIGLKLSLARSINLLYILSIILSGLSMYVFLRSFFDSVSSFTGAALYIWSPYRIVQLFQRGVLEETFTLVLVPLNFFFIKKIIEGKKQAWIYEAVILALTITSHFLVSYIFFPLFLTFFLLFYVSLSLKQKNKSFIASLIDMELDKKILLSFTTAFILGVGLSAFALFPAIFERKYIHFAESIKSVYLTNFIPWSDFLAIRLTNYSFPPIGIAYLLSIVIFFAILFLKRNSTIKQTPIILFSLMTFFYGAVLVIKSPVSLWLWTKLPFITNVNFPDIFYTAMIFSGATIVAYIVHYWGRKFFPSMIIFLAIISIFFSLNIKKITPPADEFLYIYSGATTYFDEFIPVWAQNERHGAVDNSYPYIFSLNSGVKFTTTQKNFQHISLETDSKDKDILIFKNFYFPGWLVEIDDKKIKPNITTGIEGNQILSHRKKIFKVDSPDFISQTRIDRGLMSIDLPSGKHDISFVFTDTFLRTISNIISLLSLVIILLVISLRTLKYKLKTLKLK